MKILCLLMLCGLSLPSEFASGFDYARTIYINPSTGEDSPGCLTSSNPHSPCATVTWVFQQTRQDSTNYVFSQGTHKLEGNPPHFQDLMNQAFTGNNTIITCIQSGLSFHNVEGISLLDISFSGCGALQNSTSKNYTDNTISDFLVGLYFYLCENISMFQVVISHCPNATGVAIYNTNGTNTFHDCKFSNNIVSGLYANQVGGGAFYIEYVYCAPGVVSCDAPVSQRNTGAYYAFKNCEFSYNQIIHNLENEEGQHFVTTYIVPYRSDHLVFRSGGGLSLFFKGMASDNHFIIEDCYFLNNTAQMGSGLFLDFMDSTHSNAVNISGCVFTNNHCPYSISEGAQGGAMRLGYFVYGLDGPLPSTATGNAVIVEHCIFAHNSALHGGGIAVSIALQQATNKNQLASTYLLGNHFENNTAKLGASLKVKRFGSILNGLQAEVTVEDCTFVSNTVDYTEKIGEGDTPYQTGTGTVYISEVPVWFKGEISFHANRGSALSVIGAMINFTYCHALFSDNEGYKGAAIALLGSTYMQVSSGTTMEFYHNTATTQGGAIYNTYIRRDNLKSDRTCFIRHTNPFLHPEEWNATFLFQRNKDSGGLHQNSIHSTSLLPCHVPGGSGIINTTSGSFCWKNWHYLPEQNCMEEVTSDIGNLTLTSSHIDAYPGWSFSLPIVMEDDFKHEIPDVSFEVTYNDTDATYLYRKEDFVVMGRPNEAVEMEINSLGNRIWHFNLIAKMKDCPAGFTIKNYTAHTGDVLQQCGCSGSYRGAVLCDDISKTVQITNGMWIGKLNDDEGPKYVVMECPIQFCLKTGDKYISRKADSVQQTVNWDDIFCGPTNRTGISCGECIEGFGPAVNSASYKCVDCTDINLAANIIRYVSAVYLPLIALFTILIMFDIRLTNGPANAFILYCQMVSITFDFNTFNEMSGENRANYILQFPFGIFNLKLIENFIPPICFSPGFNVLTIFLLDYAVAAFPLFMIIVASIFLRISENYCMKSVYLGVRCKRCLLSASRFASSMSGRNKTISDALLPAFASFLLLSYTKFSMTSFFILVSQSPINAIGNDVNPSRVYYAPQISTIDPSYLFYYIPAVLVMGTIVPVIPLILLDYPLKALEWCITKVKFLKMIYPKVKVHLFLNLFQGCYHAKMRFFAGLYFLYRLVIIISYIASSSWLKMLLVKQIATLFMIVLIILCQPYEQAFLNSVDSLIFLNLAVLNSFAVYFYSIMKIHPEETLPLSALIFQYFLVLLPLVYMVAYIVWAVTYNFHPRIKLAFQKLRSSQITRADDEELFSDEAMFDRAEDQNTYSPLSENAEMESAFMTNEKSSLLTSHTTETY